MPASVEALESETRRVGEFLQEKYPDLPAALHVAAVMHAQLRETAKAKQLWQRCVELAPDDERFRVNLASVAMGQGDSQAAIDALEPLVQDGQQSADVLLHYGMALNNLGRSEEAVEIMSQAVERYPNSGAHHSVLGQSQLKQGDLEAGIASLEKALELGDQPPDTYFQLAGAYRRSGDQEKAQQYNEQFQQLKAEAPIDAQQRFQKLSTAEARATAITILLEAATVHATQGDHRRAELYLLRLLSLDPAHRIACRALADHYQDRGMLREEQTVREHLVRIEPFRFENLLQLAQVSAELQQVDRAEAYLKQAVAQHPTSATPYAALAEFYLQIERTADARWYAEEAVRRAPSAEGYRFLAGTYRLLGDRAGEQRALDAAESLK